jgi:hypothetical protein
MAVRTPLTITTSRVIGVSWGLKKRLACSVARLVYSGLTPPGQRLPQVFSS